MVTGPTNIFIASSNTAMFLAQKLSDELSSYESSSFKLVPVRWWHMAPDSYISDALVRQTRQCDFAAILLTEADMDLAKADQVRDNCIYEAGLFTGALGGDPSRCFLVASCEHEKLPSDLGGLTYVRISEKGDDIYKAAIRIGQTIDKFARAGKLRVARALPLSVATSEQLRWRERDLKSDSMNIFASVTLRTQNIYSDMIANNLARGIDYTFVTEASQRNLIEIAEFVGRMAVVEDISKLGVRLKAMRTKLEILFVGERSPGIEYCIYNADDPYSATCHLRRPDLGPEMEWIEWSQGGAAIVMAEMVAKLRIHEAHITIFGSTLYYDIYANRRFMERLSSEIYRHIEDTLGSELTNEQRQEVATACFGDAFKE